MEAVDLIISVRVVRGTHVQTVYYVRLPARSIVRRGRVARYGRRVSTALYKILLPYKVSELVPEVADIINSFAVKVPLSVVENIKIF